MSGEAYLGGLVLWLVVTAAALATGWLIARARLTAVEPLPRAIAAGLLAIAAVLAAHLVPGVLGVLARGTVVAAALALLGVAGLLHRRRPAPPDRPVLPRIEVPGRAALAEWGPAAVALAALAVTVLAAGIERAPTAVVNVDGLNFHLPGVAAWIQAGGFWEVNQYVPDLAHGNYPQNGDLLLLWAVLPWHDDAFARLVGFPLLAFAVAALYALGREAGARPAAALLWAVAFASMPAVLQPATFEVLTDTLLLAALACGLLFLMRHWRTGARADLLLAGLGLGIAFGTKWYGVSSTAVVLVCWAAAWLVCRRGLAGLARSAGALILTIAAVGGFWLVRNLVESGNPLFPVRIAPLGVTIFDAPFDSARAAAGFSVAHYLGDPGVIVDFILPALWRTVSAPSLLLGLAAVAALLLSLASRGRGGLDPRVPLLAACSLGLAAAYTVTPYTALGTEGRPLYAAYNVRYLAPALLAAVPLAAWLPRRLPRLAWPWAALGAVATLVACARSLGEIGRTPKLQALLIVAALCMAGAAAAWLAVHRPPRRLALGAAAALAAGALALLAGGGQWLQSHYNDPRYSGVDPVYTWVDREAPSGHRIGLVGSWGVTRISPVWPMFGPRLGNRVFYLGPFRREMLRDYGGRRAFLTGLRSSGADLLLVARGEPPRRTVAQDRWARSAGLRPVTGSDRFTLYRVPWQ